MSKELKPRPFCGGDGYTSESAERWFAGCSDCYCNVGEAYDISAYPEHIYPTEDEAIAAWNIRAPDTRLAAAEAERDAAVARAEALADSYSKPFAAQVAEGERRATAAIVADLRLQGRTYWDGDPDADELADRYERGDHLKGTPNE